MILIVVFILNYKYSITSRTQLKGYVLVYFFGVVAVLPSFSSAILMYIVLLVLDMSSEKERQAIVDILGRNSVNIIVVSGSISLFSSDL